MNLLCTRFWSEVSQPKLRPHFKVIHTYTVYQYLYFIFPHTSDSVRIKKDYDNLSSFAETRCASSFSLYSLDIVISLDNTSKNLGDVRTFFLSFLILAFSISSIFSYSVRITGRIPVSTVFRDEAIVSCLASLLNRLSSSAYC